MKKRRFATSRPWVMLIYNIGMIITVLAMHIYLITANKDYFIDSKLRTYVILIEVQTGILVLYNLIVLLLCNSSS
jgi:hypothetical protein